MADKPYIDTYVGAGVSKRLVVSPEGIAWMGTYWPFENIVRIRWASGANATGSDRKRDFCIGWGDLNSSTELETSYMPLFEDLVAILLKAVGKRIYFDLLKGLSQGKRYKFHSSKPPQSTWRNRSELRPPDYDYVLIDDRGVEFFKTSYNKIIPESIFTEWSNIHLSHEHETLYIYNGGECACFSYFWVFNIQIMVQIIDNFRYSNYKCPSELLHQFDSTHNINQDSQESNTNKHKEFNDVVSTLLATLDLSQPTTFAEINNRYHILLKIFHPDKYSHDSQLMAYAEKKCKEINTAYDLLREYYSQD